MTSPRARTCALQASPRGSDTYFRARPDVFRARPDVFRARPDVFRAGRDVFGAGADAFGAGAAVVARADVVAAVADEAARRFRANSRCPTTSFSTRSNVLSTISSGDGSWSSSGTAGMAGV
jgi:hypothetical protein